jgi:isopenicillin N synthase-like dioxygenase
LELTKWFFSLPTSVKQKVSSKFNVSISKPERGFYRYVSEALHQDSIQAFQLGAEFETSSSSSSSPLIHDIMAQGNHKLSSIIRPGSPSPLQSRTPYLDTIDMPNEFRNVGRTGNIWPHSALHDSQSTSLLSSSDMQLADEFHDVFVAYFLAGQLTAFSLMQQISIALGWPADKVQRAHRRHDSLLELKYYPALKLRGNQTRLVSHADLTSFTLLAQDVEGGLEVQRSQTQDPSESAESEDNWIAAPARVDAILVNTGDFMARVDALHRFLLHHNNLFLK